MKLIYQVLSFVVFSVAVRITCATINSSVNVHFVPPLVAGNCIFARWWNPPNVTCATCFCMTGTLSRCFPTPGCNPNPGNPPENATQAHANPTPPPAAAAAATNQSPPATSASMPPSGDPSTPAAASATTPPGATSAGTSATTTGSAATTTASVPSTAASTLRLRRINPPTINLSLS